MSHSAHPELPDIIHTDPEWLRSEIKSMERMTKLYKAILKMQGEGLETPDLHTPPSPAPAPASNVETPAILLRIVADGKLSLARTCFAVVYFLGPQTMDDIYQLLLKQGRLEEIASGKRKDRIRSSLWGEARGPKAKKRVVWNKETDTYEFASRKSKVWFHNLLMESGYDPGKAGPP